MPMRVIQYSRTTGGRARNKSKAAKALGICRNTLYARLDP